jgi:hypothetical protein
LVYGTLVNPVTFRKHMLTESGRISHTVYFSIVDEEWPVVKTRLEAALHIHPAVDV